MKIHFLSSGSAKAQEIFVSFTKKYGQVDLANADVIVSLSGDGMVLRALHENPNLPVYGINCGGIGFLTNNLDVSSDLEIMINQAFKLPISPLTAIAITNDKEVIELQAFNEIYLFRASHQAAKINVYIDDMCRVSELACDGVIVSTPIGSTAYNTSVGGPIIPLTSDLLSLVPISPFRPKYWRGALLSNRTKIRLEVVDPTRRPVNAVADYIEEKNITNISIEYNLKPTATLLLDSLSAIHEKVLKAQFDC